jgi:hypothetical protein
VLKKLLNKNRLTEQESLVNSIVAIGDILDTEIRQGGTEYIESYVGRLPGLLEEVWNHRESNPEKFASLFYSPEYIDWWKKDKQEASFRMEFYADKHLALCSAVLKQIFRLHSTADTHANMDASYYTYGAMLRVLELFSQDEGLDFYCKYTLDRLVAEVYTKFRKDEVPSTLITYRWYFTVVNDDKFHVDFLPVFGEHLIQTMHAVVREGDTDLFNNFISHACHSRLTHHVDDVGNHLHQMTNLVPREERWDLYTKEERVLRKQSGNVYEIDDIRALLDEITQFKNSIKKKVSRDNIPPLTKHFEEACSAVREQFKYRSFLGLIYNICSFCLLRNRPEMIYALWNFKQPADSDATWVGSDIYPRSIQSLCDIYFIQLRAGMNVDFNEEHHGSRIYADQYFLLNTIQIFTKSVFVGKNTVPTSATSGMNALGQAVPTVSMNDYPLGILGSLTHYTDKLKTRIPALFSNQALDVLGIDMTEEMKVFLIGFLDQLAKTGSEKLAQLHQGGKLSQAKKKEFTQQITDSFYSSLAIRPLIEKYGIVKTVEPRQQESLFGINRLDDKAMLFDEWYISFGDWGTTYGEGLASGEDGDLLQMMHDGCDLVSADKVKDTLTQIGADKCIIISSYEFLYGGWLDKQEEYEGEWLYRQHPEANENLFNQKGFAGVFKCDGEAVPVFQSNADALKGTLMILNQSRIGELDIIPPTDEEKEEFDSNNNLLIKIVAFSDDEELLNSYLKDPPEWLIKKGEEVERRNHMKTLVGVQVYKKTDYHLGEKPIGYVLKMENGGAE